MTQEHEVQVVIDPVGDEALDVWSDPSRRHIGEGEDHPSSFQRLARFFTTPSGGSVSGLVASDLALWADYSHWNGVINLTLTQPLLDGVMFKLCDGKQMYAGTSTDTNNYKDRQVDANIQKAYDIGLPVVLYHYTHFVLDAGWNLQTIVDWQVRVIRDALKGKTPGVSYHGFALDIEETGGQTSTNAQWILETLYNTLYNLPEFAGIKIIFYSSNGFLGRLPAVRDWLSFPGSNKNLWLAQWIFTTRVRVTWEQLYSLYIDRINMKVITPGFADWRWVQWAACFELPGCSVNYTDVNFFKGDKNASNAFFNYKGKNPTPVPNPDPDPDPAPVPDPSKEYVTPAQLTAALEAQKTLLTQQITLQNGQIESVKVDVAALKKFRDDHRKV